MSERETVFFAFTLFLRLCFKTNDSRAKQQTERVFVCNAARIRLEGLDLKGMIAADTHTLARSHIERENRAKEGVRNEQ